MKGTTTVYRRLIYVRIMRTLYGAFILPLKVLRRELAKESVMNGPISHTTYSITKHLNIILEDLLALITGPSDPLAQASCHLANLVCMKLLACFFL